MEGWEAGKVSVTSGVDTECLLMLMKKQKNKEGSRPVLFTRDLLPQQPLGDYICKVS